MSNYPKLELQNISIQKNSHNVLNNVNITIRTKSKSIVLGKSGSGKTSLLRLLNRLDEPAEGNILYNSKNINDLDVRKLRTNIALIQQIPIILGITVKEDLAIQSSLDLAPYPSTDNMVSAIELCGLSEQYIDRNTSELSVGEKQRLCIARTIINKPDVLLLDEPTSSLDRDNSTKILQLINNLNKELGITIILVTHKVEESELLKADYYTISQGKIHTGII